MHTQSHITQASASVFNDVQNLFKGQTKTQRHALGSGIMRGVMGNLSLMLTAKYKNTGDISAAAAKDLVSSIRTMRYIVVASPPHPTSPRPTHP